MYEAMSQKLLLQLTAEKVYPYGNPDTLIMCGIFSVHFVFKHRSVTSPMYMVTNATDTLLSYATA